jgi:hypothetical protein
MEMIVIFGLAAAYFFVFNCYRHCTIWVLLSTICLQISDSGSNENILRLCSPLFIVLHYFALSVNSEQLELAAITGALGLAIVTSSAFKNETVLPESRSSSRPKKEEEKVAPVSAPTPMIENTGTRRVEIITPSQPQPSQVAITPGKSILKSVRSRKPETPESPESETTETKETPIKKPNVRRKSAGGVSGMDADVLDALTSSNSGEAASVSTATTKRRKSSGGASRNNSGEDLVAQARAAARAEMELAAQNAAYIISAPTNKRGAKRRAPMTEDQIASVARVAVAAVEAMAVDDEGGDSDTEPLPSPKKLRTTRKRASKMDL